MALGWASVLLAVFVAFLVKRVKGSGVKQSAIQVVRSFGSGRYLQGKTALVTGGNAGIGLETVKALASVGCRVLLCSRSVDAGTKAVESEIKKDGLGSYSVTDTSNIVVKQLDLENLDSIRRLCDDVAATEQCIDILILNAGIMSLPKLEKNSPGGWEKQMGVNHFGHALLTKKLRPLLNKSKDTARVISLASTAHRFSSKSFIDDPTYTKGRRYTPWVAYGDSKLANLMYAKALAKDFAAKSERATAVSVHPGVIKTALWNQSPINRLFSLFVGDRDVPQGAASTVWAAVAPRVLQPDMRGAYIADCGPERPMDFAEDEGLVQKLWDVTESELERVG